MTEENLGKQPGKDWKTALDKFGNGQEKVDKRSGKSLENGTGKVWKTGKKNLENIQEKSWKTALKKLGKRAGKSL